MSLATPPPVLSSAGIAPGGHAFVFPGQGSQQWRMGADLIGPASTYGRLLERAGQLSGTDLVVALGLTARGRDGSTNAASAADADTNSDASGAQPQFTTVETQLSVLALSVSLVVELSQRGLEAAVVAGHSLGEFSALVAGGWLDADDALEFVAARAAAMAECCTPGTSAMAAVVGMPQELLEELVAPSEGTVVVANRNSTRQSVISGTTEAVRQVSKAAKESGASAVLELPVAGAFHSPLMAQAQDRLIGLVGALSLRPGRVPLVSSVTGELVTDLGQYRDALTHQVCAPVEWLAVMKQIRALGVSTVVEVGPGRVLRSLFRQLDRRWPTVGCECAQDCRRFAEQERGATDLLAG